MRVAAAGIAECSRARVFVVGRPGGPPARFAVAWVTTGLPRVRNESMSYTISISDSRKFLRVRVEGDMSAAGAREWSAELREASRAQGVRRFLIDVSSSRNVSTVLENYQYATETPMNWTCRKTRGARF